MKTLLYFFIDRWKFFLTVIAIIIFLAWLNDYIGNLMYGGD